MARKKAKAGQEDRKSPTAGETEATAQNAKGAAKAETSSTQAGRSAAPSSFPASAKSAVPRSGRRSPHVLGMMLGALGLFAIGALAAGSQMAGWLDPRGCKASAPEDRPLLLVAELEGDLGAEISDQLVAALEDLPGLAVRPLCESLAEETGAAATLDPVQAEDVRRKMKARAAEGLLWGEVDRESGSLILRILAAEASTAELPPALFQVRAMELPLPGAEAELLPAPVFQENLEVLALSAFLPQAPRLPTLLTERLEALQALAEAEQPAPDLDHLGASLLLLADAERQLGLASGERPWLVRAGEAYRKGLIAFSRKRDPLLWGAAQARYGDLLQRLSDAETGDHRLREAARAFRAALEVFQREVDPVSWAALQSQLGGALARLGEMRENGGAIRLRQAVTSLEAALEVFDREAAPLAWAQTTAHLARARFALGARRGDPLAIARAQEAAEAALAVFTERPSPESRQTSEALRRLLTAIAELPIAQTGSPQAQTGAVTVH